jgi:hypothetical protein
MYSMWGADMLYRRARLALQQSLRMRQVLGGLCMWGKPPSHKHPTQGNRCTSVCLGAVSGQHLAMHCGMLHLPITDPEAVQC